MGFQRIEGGWRFFFGGIKTNKAADKLPPNKYPYARNVRQVKSLQTRPGYESLFTTIRTFSDDFNRANGPIGSNWETMDEGGITVPAIVSNQFHAGIGTTGPGDNSTGTYRVIPSIIPESAAPQSARIQIASFSIGANASVQATVFVHFQADFNGAFLNWTKTTGGSPIELLTLDNGNGDTTSASVTLSAGDTIQIAPDGTGGLLGKVNGVTILSLPDQGPWIGTTGFNIVASGFDATFINLDNYFSEF